MWDWAGCHCKNHMTVPLTPCYALISHLDYLATLLSICIIYSLEKSESHPSRKTAVFETGKTHQATWALGDLPVKACDVVYLERWAEG